MATAGTVLLASTPAHAEFTTPVASGDDISPCETGSGNSDPLTARDWAGDFIGLDEAHQFNLGATDEGDPVTIAVIDSGVEKSLTDIFGTRVKSGWDAWDPDSDGTCDAHGHGTAVAAIAAGAAQGEQFVGVAPRAEILPLRAFIGDDGADANRSRLVAELIDDAVANGADVINISITLPDTTFLQEAVANAIAANVVIVAATGNDNLHMDDPAVLADPEQAKFFPANYEDVIAVGAHNQDGNFYVQTNYGENIDLIAPGQNVVVPLPGGGWVPTQGTSFAAPYVAGAAALLKAEFGTDVSPAWVEHRLTTTAIHPPNDFNIYQGHGVLNVGAAVSTPLAPGEDPTATSFSDAPTDGESSDPGSQPTPEQEPSSIAAIDVDYDPLAFEKTVAWASVGGSIVLVALVLVLRTIIPKGRRRRWRAGTRDPDRVKEPERSLEKAESGA
ncbi:S8 family peptidase [Glycomyces albidus]|uniref:S8 family serine peptidase n=1 Tax=Glycomyces albidus TaxID=2656774 RepID=A0A6L5GHF2_9ACTN|nr:S8 family serine peptidase [Glycomyces albidus]MQM28996.1 S8 family serine peptidase [Glycomyces albidus]